MRRSHPGCATGTHAPGRSPVSPTAGARGRAPSATPGRVADVPEGRDPPVGSASRSALRQGLLSRRRSSWIPGSYAPALSEKHNAFLRPLKNQGLKEESMTKFGMDAISMSTTLESNKSL